MQKNELIVIENLVSLMDKLLWNCFDLEINFVGEWCAATLLRTPNNQHNIVARCLAYIQNHSDVAMIFHPSHILSSGRLKHGLESYKKKEQEETNKDILL